MIRAASPTTFPAALPAALLARDLGFVAGETELIRNINLRFRQGELVAIVGPNGAGKSTLLKLLAGDLPATRGDVLLGAEPILKIPIADLALQRAFLSQSPQLELAFSVHSIVEMGRYPHRSQPYNSPDLDHRMINAALARVGITHLADRIVASLSGGERQRVNLARVIAQDAPVLLMDEPTTFTDVAHQEQIMTQARGIASGGACVVAIIHDLNLAAAYANRIVLLTNGQVAASGQPAQVLTSAALSEIYQLEMRVIEHPFRPGPLVLTVPT